MNTAESPDDGATGACMMNALQRGRRVNTAESETRIDFAVERIRRFNGAAA